MVALFLLEKGDAMKAFIQFYTVLFFFAIGATSLNAATACTGTTANCSYNVTAAELAAKIQGNGITITNPTIVHGDGSQVGIFSNGINGAGLELDEGIILTGMDVENSFKPNTSWGKSIEASGTFNDPDLTAIDANAIYNPIVFEFDVTLDANTRLLLIDYQFASEEYNEFVGSQFNDAFGFFISGGDLGQTYNIARVVDNQTYVKIANLNNYDTVTVNNVNNGVNSSNSYYGQSASPKNSSFYIDNCNDTFPSWLGCTQTNSPVAVEYDGLTHTLHATLDNLTPGQTYHFKMAIADTGDSAWDTGVFVHKITGLREPSICYDYAYKQGDRYVTADYNATTGPSISANVSTTQPLEVAMYFENTTSSELTVSNVKVNVLDINATNQASYSPNSVYVTQPGSILKEFIPDLNGVGMVTNNNEILNIPINSFDSLEHFYTYFSIDSNASAITLPIKARLDYNLTIPLSATQSVTIPRSSLIDSDIPICGGGVSQYTPVYGIFNIIEDGLNTAINSNGDNLIYNLNTQVINRAADVSIVSMDVNNLDKLKDINGSIAVAVDMVDLGSFHDTSASCNEASNAISPRIWTTLDNVSKVELSLTPTEVRANSAFRISYNMDAANNGIIELIPIIDNGVKKWNVANFPTLNGNCLQDMDGNPNSVDTIPQYCNNAGKSNASAMTFNELQTCQECIYGYNTTFICSRDNFSIRPEAFSITLQDQNQTTPATKPLIAKNTTPTTDIQLSAGYQYNIEVNATSHTDTVASLGYYKGINTNYKWSPITGKDLSGCNDTVDKNATINFANGIADKNTSVNQVGHYSLNIEDTTWTQVDSDSAYMAHHLNPLLSAHFLSGADCTINSNFVNTSAANDALNGCEISSNHTNNDASIIYTDLNVTFHPYKFDLNGTNGGSPITPTIGLLFTLVPNTTPYIYMSDINKSQDENMSYHLNGSINALGENNVTLTNFVDKCYAVPLDINISTSNRDLNDSNGNHVDYRVRFHDINSSNKVITALDINVTDDATTSHTADLLLQTVQTSTKGYFPKNLNGTMQTRLNMNYARTKDTTINPKSLTFIKYQVNCTNVGADCTFNADLINNKTTKGSKDLNSTIPIRHYYGRTHAPRQTFEGPDGNVSMYYEVYCNGATCNKTLLQNGTDSNTTDDPRWFINTLHSNEAGTAAQSATLQKNAANVSITREANGNHPDYIGVQYNGNRGYPYKATMENNASGWLIYNKYNDNALKNEFEVEFVKPGGAWAGAHETNTTTDTNASKRTNRRIMW